MGVLRLCSIDCPETIRAINVDSIDKISDLFEVFFESVEKKDAAFVGFQNWRNYEMKNERPRVVISNDFETFEIDEIDYISSINMSQVDYSLFAFNSMNEAAKFCVSLYDGE